MLVILPSDDDVEKVGSVNLVSVDTCTGNTIATNAIITTTFDKVSVDATASAEIATAASKVYDNFYSEKLLNYRMHKHTLYGKQEGYCNGCKGHFPFRNMTIDHIVPRSKGGTDHEENLQLLCGACNSRKNNDTQAELIARLKKQGFCDL